MRSQDWSDAENDLIVADYFAMLADDHAGRPYNKAEHNRGLQAQIDRSRGAIEFKHQNISAVLLGLNEAWIEGYKPAANFQTPLVAAVVRWLARNPGWIARAPAAPPPGLHEDAQLYIAHAPTLSNRPPPEHLDQTLRMAARFDAAGRDERNRALGRAGEARVLAHERAVLAAEGRHDLARAVRWTSQEDGDGAGYDIASFTPDGRPRLIEVKTTNGWERAPFVITRNELAVSRDRGTEWSLLRLWNFSRAPRAFELRPPLEAHLSLTAASFHASFG